MEAKIFCNDCGREIAKADAVEIGGECYCAECVVECYDCGEIVPRDCAAYCEENGEHYCERCAEYALSWCDRCERYMLNDNFEEVRGVYGRSEYWCGECADRDAERCEDCGDLYERDALYEVRGGRMVCNSCIEENYYCCEECGEYVHADEWAGDCCIDCAGSSLIVGYHDAEKGRLTGEKRPQWRGIWRGLGVELEIDRNYRDRYAERALVEKLLDIAGEALVFERDGSLDCGFEIITQPHTEDAFFAIPWGDILEACSDAGYTSHDNGRCGLHVHLSREVFGATEDTQERAISKLIRFYDIFYKDIVAVSRREESDARHWAAPHDTQSNDDAKVAAKGKRYSCRYKAVNTSNENTIEIRIMRGTLCEKSFMACVRFVLATAKASRRIRWRDIASPAEWLRGIDENTREYIKKRGAFSEVF